MCSQPPGTSSPLQRISDTCRARSSNAFDTTYSDVLGLTRGRPFGVVIHGESDTAGALVGIEKVTTGLQWRLVAAPVESIGVVGDLEIAACVELGAVVAASTLDL